MSDFQYIIDTYDVKACINRLVKVDGKAGIIIKDCGNYIGVNFDDDKPGQISNCHPTWRVEYLGIGEQRPMTRSQRRYQKYLEYGDCFNSFIEFCYSDIARDV